MTTRTQKKKTFKKKLCFEHGKMIKSDIEKKQ